jgi:small-conductance mechanosensitive channel
MIGTNMDVNPRNQETKSRRANPQLDSARRALAKRRPIVLFSLLAIFFGFFVPSSSRAAPTQGDEVLYFLNHTVDWFHQVTSLTQSSVDPAEIIYRDAVRDASVKVLRYGFDFAHSDALIITANSAGTQPTSAKSQTLAQTAAAAAQRLATLQAQMAELDQELSAGGATTRPTLQAQRDKVADELQLAKARNDSIQSLRSVTATGGEGDLVQKVDDLRSTVPEALPDQATATMTKAAVAADASSMQDAFHPETSGIIGLITEMFSLTQRMSQLNELSKQADDLQQTNQAMLAPLRTELQATFKRVDALSVTDDSESADQLAADRHELEAILARYMQLSAAGRPLSEQSTFLDTTKLNFTQWGKVLDYQYNRSLKYLLIRLGGMVGGIIIVLAISKIWRHATFRYIRDIRRRRMFLMVRRVVVGCIIILVVVATFITEFGSLATYAGLLTAGIAVALQSVILSGVAYFFFIGRYGIRIGDRVTISGVTGDVVDLGLFRLYLMELKGQGLDLHPSGRVVVFSNSVLFQPQAFYKQLPGTDYTWHEVCLTLSPDSDYHLAGKRLLAAVESIFNEYKDEIDRQHEEASKLIHIEMPPPRPNGRLRLHDQGLEYVIRYPVQIRNAPEIDEKVTSKLVETIEEEPKLKLVATSTPEIQAADA